MGGKNIERFGIFLPVIFLPSNTERKDIGVDAVNPRAAPECSRNQNYIAPITLPQTNFRKHQKDHRKFFAAMKYYADTTCGRHIMFNPEGTGLGDGLAGAVVYDELPTCPE